MATLRDSMSNKWWAAMYDRYNFHDPSLANYGRLGVPGLNTPLTIDSNPVFTVQLSRHCNGVCTYDIGGVSPIGHATHQEIDYCSDNSGAPFICARGILGPKVEFKGNPQFNRLG